MLRSAEGPKDYNRKQTSHEGRSPAASAVVLLFASFSCCVGITAAQPLIGATLGTWSTAALSVARSYFVATSLPNEGLAMFGGGWSGISYDVVDIFNMTSRNWSTAVLSLARQDLAATSLPPFGLALFGGGGVTCSLH
jgi:hypothetical protein